MHVEYVFFINYILVYRTDIHIYNLIVQISRCKIEVWTLKTTKCNDTLSLCLPSKLLESRNQIILPCLQNHAVVSRLG